MSRYRGLRGVRYSPDATAIVQARAARGRRSPGGRTDMAERCGLVMRSLFVARGGVRVARYGASTLMMTSSLFEAPASSVTVRVKAEMPPAR